MPRQLPIKSKPLPALFGPPPKSSPTTSSGFFNYDSVGTYLNHAKSFLKRFKAKESLTSQLHIFASTKSITGRSILNCFARFLEEKNIVSLENDLVAKNPLPLSNVYVKLFLLLNSDRLRWPTTRAAYATNLNGYFEKIGDLKHFEKLTAQRLKDKLFPGLNYKLLRKLVVALFNKIKLSSQGEKLSPPSLRHTAGKLLYDEGVPLEFIQRTLRHRSMQSTMVYANKAIEQNFFKR